ncbi:MAG: M20 family metallopeptidase [Thaumarchaeota archaeon]|nr:M20 family metallopeptidase [Nitrososphaerota archaeon]
MELLELASSLISFNTVTPPGNEEPCARFIKDYLDDLHIQGAEVDLHNFAKDRSNVVATFGGSSAGLLLAGHMDVVPVNDEGAWTSPPFQAKVREARLYGRGSADMKSGLAAMLAAISSAKGRRLKRTLSLVATAGEEVGYDGLIALVDDKGMKRVKARYGVVGEPTEMKVVRAHRGGISVRITFEGRSAHAGDPSLGINSIENCTLFMKHLDVLRKRLAKTKDPDLGHTIVTPTMINGGSKSNVIPGSCELTLDSRVIPEIGSKTVIDGLNSAIADLSSRDERFKARLEVLYQASALSVPREAEVVKITESLTGSRSAAAPYCTEAPIYSEQGTPTVVLGPGSVKQAHIVDEYAPVEQIERAEAVYRQMIEKLCL